MSIYDKLRSALEYRLRHARPRVLFALSLAIALLLRPPGLRFALFGLLCGRKCRKAGNNELAASLYITPVHCLRYFEYAFLEKTLPSRMIGRCLDVSSPRLWDVYVLENNRDVCLDVINPDGNDLNLTRELIECAVKDKTRVNLHNLYVSDCPFPASTFDYIWSISVVEHIPAPHDIDALRIIWQMLKPGGDFILTVPVMKTRRDDFRDEHAYGLDKHVKKTGKGVFFQRWYDADMLRDRIFQVLPDLEIINQEIWGERKKGWLDWHTDEWLKSGVHFIAKDPFYASTKFKSYSDVSSLPGGGVICLHLRKYV